MRNARLDKKVKKIAIKGKKMNKTVLYTVAALVAVIVTYLGSVIFIGGQVESAISSIEADMIQSDELIVHRFEYESGFSGGVLSYDLELSPAFDGMTGELLAEIAAAIGELRAEGTLDVTHGPWIGNEMGFAAAGTKLEFPVGDEVRQLLPQYPGSRRRQRFTPRWGSVAAPACVSRPWPTTAGWSWKTNRSH